MPATAPSGHHIQNPPCESKGGLFKIDAPFDEVALAICGPQHNLATPPKSTPSPEEEISAQNLVVRFGKQVSALINSEASRRGLPSEALIKKVVKLLIEDSLWGAVLDD